MVHRTFKKHDQNIGKYNGIGGKLKCDEDVAAGMIREIMEETSLTVVSMKLRGTVSWSNFGPLKQDWLAFVFLIDKFSGNAVASNDEVTLHWTPLTELCNLPMWKGDKYFLDMVFDANPNLFYGYMSYDGEEPDAWQYTRM